MKTNYLNLTKIKFRILVIVSFLFLHGCQNKIVWKKIPASNIDTCQLDKMVVVLEYTNYCGSNKNCLLHLICQIKFSHDTIRILSEDCCVSFEKNEHIFFHSKPIDELDSLMIPYNKRTIKYLNSNFPIYYGTITSLYD